MNPYSFKRFLENPGRPRHPIQLVQTGSNRIIVQGDLPDCVRNGDVGFLAASESSTLRGAVGSLQPQGSHRNLLQSSPLDDLAPTPSPALVTAVGVHSNEGQQSVSRSHTRSHMPDIHLCTSTGTRSNPALDTSLTPPTGELTESMGRINSRGLPDFLPRRFVEVEANIASVCSHRPPLAIVGQSLSLQSSSLPSLLLGVVENHIRRIPASSKSSEQLISAQANNSKSPETCADRDGLFSNGSNSILMRTNQDTEYGSHWSSQTTPSSSQADPFVDAHPVSVPGSISSPDPRFLTQQEKIEVVSRVFIKLLQSSVVLLKRS